MSDTEQRLAEIRERLAGYHPGAWAWADLSWLLERFDAEREASQTAIANALHEAEMLDAYARSLEQRLAEADVREASTGTRKIPPHDPLCPNREARYQS